MSLLGNNQAYIRNCLSIETSEHGILPLRFTQRQLVEYAKTDGFRLRSLSPAGVCLDVMTDATYLNLDVQVHGYARTYCFFDLYIDNQFVESFDLNPIAKDCYHLTFQLPSPLGGIRRVTLYLPHCTELTISEISWSANAFLAPVIPYEQHLLCLGDSITQGMDAIHPSNTYAVLLSHHLRMNLLNQGVGGYVFEVNSLDADLPYSPDIITVAYGTNDWGKRKDIAEFSDHAHAYLDRLVTTFPKAAIYVITPLWRKDMDESKKMGTFDELVEAFIQVCSHWPSIHLIRGTELIPPDATLFADGVHPKEEGFKLMAAQLATIMKHRTPHNI